MEVEMRHLRLLLAVADAGSLSGAARVLGVSQPALSASVSRLERRMGIVVFDRGRGGVEVTESGRVLLQRARRLVGDLDDALAASRLAEAQVSRSVRVGGGVGPLLYALSSALAEAHPEWTVSSVHHASSRNVLKAVARGDLDAGLCATWPAEAQLPVPPEVATTALVAFEPVFAACAHDHALVGLAARRGGQAGQAPTVRLSDLAEYDWLHYTGSDDGEVEHVLAACREAGFVPLLRHNAHDSASALALLTSRTAVSLGSPTSSDREVFLLALEGDPVGRGLHLAWHRDSPFAAHVPEVHDTALAAYRDLTTRNRTYPAWLSARPAGGQGRREAS